MKSVIKYYNESEGEYNSKFCSIAIFNKAEISHKHNLYEDILTKLEFYLEKLCSKSKKNFKKYHGII